MITFRDEHLKEFEKAHISSLVDRIAHHLRSQHSLALGPIEEDSLRARIKRGLTRACSYGVTREAALFRFVVLMVEVNDQFDEHPAIRLVLSDKNLPPDQRVSALFERVKDIEWDEARKGKGSIPAVRREK